MVDLNKIFGEKSEDVNTQTEKAFSIKRENVANYLRGNEEGELTREDIIGNKQFIKDARTFLADRDGDLKHLSSSNKEIFDDFMNHFRYQDTNEWTAGKDLQYAQDLAEASRDKNNLQRAEDARKKITAMHNVTMAYDKMTGESGTWDFFLDYAGSLAKAPSTYLGLISGGAAKAGAIAGQQALKFGLRRVLAASLKGSIAPVIVEGAAGAVQGAAQQKTRQEVGLEGDPLLGGAIGFAGGAIPAGVISTGLGALRYTKGYKTGSLVREGTEARKAKAEEAQRLTEVTLRQKDAKAVFFRDQLKEVVDETIEIEAKSKAKKSQKDRALPTDKVKGGMKIEKKISPTGYLVGLEEKTVDRIIAASIEIAESIGWQTTDNPNRRITMAVADAIEAASITDAKIAAAKETAKLRSRGMSGVMRTLGEEPPAKPAIAKKELRKEELIKIADKYNLTPDELAMVFIADASQAGRLLGKLSAMKGKLTPTDITNAKIARKEHKDIVDSLSIIDPEITKVLDENLARVGKTGQKTWELVKNVDILRRGLMVVQPKTTIRNLMNAGIRAPIYMLDHGMYDLLQNGRLTGFKSAIKLPLDFLSRGDAEALALVFKKGNPLTYQRVFREAMDLNEELGAGSGFARVGRKINVINTLLDNGIKKSIFLNEVRTAIGGEEALKAYMGGKGGAKKNLDFNDWFRQNPELAAKAMDEALSFTYQKGFKKGTAAGTITQLSSNPLFTAFVPFPRFLVNQTQFMYEHAPLLSFAGAAVKKAKGKPLGINMRERITKQITGSLFLYGALQVRAMQGPETPWNYIKDQNTGMLYDITALLGPFAPFFFGADVILRANKGQLKELSPVITEESRNKYEKSNWDEINWRDVSKAFTGMQIKGGIDTGFVVLDELFTEIATAGQGEETGEKLFRIGTKFSANYLRTFTIPVGVFKDIDATFDPEGRKIMDTDSADLGALFIRKVLAGLPETKAVANFETYLGIKSDFSDSLRQARAEGEEEQDRLYIPTSSGEEGFVERKMPISATLLGITARQPFNLIERELGRLNKPYYWWYGKDKNILADRIMKKTMGELSDQLAPAFIKSSTYQNAKRRAQVIYLGNLRSSYRKMAMDVTRSKLATLKLTPEEEEEVSKVIKTMPTEADKKKFEDLTLDERKAAREAWEGFYPELPSLDDSKAYDWAVGYIKSQRPIGKAD